MIIRNFIAAIALILCSVAHAQGPFVGQPGQFDYYVLTLSWEPTYCQQQDADAQECGGPNHGFVLHGLWPQMLAGGYPANCPTTLQLDADALKFQNDNRVFPSDGLLQHEWTTHGVCDGRFAGDYLAAADQAKASIQIPANLQSGASASAMSASDISDGFQEANPGLPSQSVTVHCKGNQLKEVQICLDKSLQPMSCGSGVSTQCPGGRLKVPGLR